MGIKNMIIEKDKDFNRIKVYPAPQKTRTNALEIELNLWGLIMTRIKGIRKGSEKGIYNTDLIEGEIEYDLPRGIKVKYIKNIRISYEA